ncbi:hypothetical protein ISG33_14555 [Glaciecola sp. MH2013]|uniref:hypothetical protein n=1 Tax=Glaciecola sp. MH2013 TaxID=2785524 RepID=UPI00189C608E|nr:hypothetical protein [Glaciecola sp. MH2013]MBF7074624.1 hypothetical protein [Glaciecola sp. MH2013]
MISSLVDRFGIDARLIKSTRLLNEQYSNKDYFELTEVDTVLEQLKLGRYKALPLLYAAHCNAKSFYTRFEHTDFDYRQLRMQIAKICFGSKIEFDSNILRQYALDKIIHIDEPFYDKPKGTTRGSSTHPTDAGSD